MTHPDLVAAAELLAAGDRKTASETEEAELTESLYSWYLNVTPLPHHGGRLLPYELSLPSALRAAQLDTTRFEGGWRVKNASTWGRVVAVKGALTRVLERGEYTVPLRPGLRPKPNDAILVARSWTWVDEDTGFWHARRGTWPPAEADRLTRIYWNTAPRESPAVVGRLSHVLAEHDSASSMLKTPAHYEHGGRADAVVLYLGPADFAALEHDLIATAQELSPLLRPPTPRFTLQLAPGVGLAEGSLEGDSFGETRCRLVARAFVTTSEPLRAEPARLVEAIGEVFSAHGLDPERPYLEPDPTRDYVD